jgi:L-phenylalanine/L-methionine N-acetyltransferase
VTEIVVRRAEPGDAEGVAATFRARGASSGTLQNPYPSTAQWHERLTTDAMTNYVFVALADGQIVGNCGLHGNKNPRRQHAWGIGMSVRDDWQGKGVGTRMMATMIDLADNWLGALRLELTVYVDNPVAQRLYKNFGFVVEGTHRAFALRDGQFIDALMMARLHPNPPRLGATATPAA